MKLRCKPGDLAVIVTATYDTQHIGKIVQVVQLFDSDSWICDPDLRSKDGHLLAWVDSMLRPIRDQEGDDETLSWASVPDEVMA